MDVIDDHRHLLPGLDRLPLEVPDGLAVAVAPLRSPSVAVVLTPHPIDTFRVPWAFIGERTLGHTSGTGPPS